jgi:hypothetical protein
MLRAGIVLLIGSCAYGQTVWTNAAGRAFRAELVELDDRRVVFVMGDGTTNNLSISALHPESQAAARTQRQLPVIPDVLLATFDLTAAELRRIRYQHEDGKLDAVAHAEFQRRLLNGFRTMYERHGLPEEARVVLEQRLLNAALAPRGKPAGDARRTE